MKDAIHPQYHPVVFKDAATGEMILTRSTMSSEKTVEWTDGKTYPVIQLEVTSFSHPFYTGTQRIVDTEGRIERFKKRYTR